MPVIFDAFTGQIIDTGPAGGMSIGGPVAGADPNSVLVVDASLTLQNVEMPSNGQLLIGSAGSLPVAATLTQASASQVVITNGPGTITLGLPQNISSADSPVFTGLTLSSLSGPVKAGIGGALSASAIDLATSEVTNILTVDKGGTGVNGSAAPNGHILIGNGTGYTLADILGTTHQVSVANGAGSIQLSLPQDIHTGASPEFFDLFLAGTVDTAVLGGTLALGTNKANIINIGSPTATINIQGTTIYQNVSNLNVTDKNITVNVGGSVGSSGGAGIHVEEGGVSNAGHAEVTGDRLGWEFHPPGVAGIAYLYPGASGITLDQDSHDPVTIATPANGLGILNQELSIELSSASATGALSSTDWSTFDGKQDALSATAPLALDGLTDTLSISQSNTTTDGYLSSTDWNTFNDKEDYVSPGLTTQFYRGDKTWTQVDLTNAVSGTLPFANGGLGFNTATSEAYFLLTINATEDGVIKRELIASDGIALNQDDDKIELYNPNYVVGDTAVNETTVFVETSDQPIGITLDNEAKSIKMLITLFFTIGGNVETSVVDVYLYQTGTIPSWASYDKTISYSGGVELVGLDVNVNAFNQITIDLGVIPGTTTGDFAECFSRAFNYA
jgi:hypothetical protein